MLHTYKTNDANLGLRISIILHAIFVCILALMRHNIPSDTMPKQYVEVASLILKPASKSDIFSRPNQPENTVPPIPKREKIQPRPEDDPKINQTPDLSDSSSDNLGPILKAGDSDSGPGEGSSEFGTGPVGGRLGSGNGTGTAVAGSGDGAGTDGLSSGGYGEGGVGPGDDGLWNEYGRKLLSVCERFKRYPPVAIRRGWQGTAEVLIHFSSDGRTISVTIDKSSGQSVLDEQAIEMVRKGLDELPLPSNYQGRDVKLIIPIDFKLE